METSTLWKFETTRFIIKWDVTEDDDVDLSWDETGEVAQKLVDGTYQAFISDITVTHKKSGMILGHSTLSGSIYEDPADFRDHVGINEKSRRDGRNYGSYFSDMVREAVTEAHERWAELKADVCQ